MDGKLLSNWSRLYLHDITINNSDRIRILWYCHQNQTLYGSGQGTGAALLPGFAINWWQNHVTWQPQFHDLTHTIRISWGCYWYQVCYDLDSVISLLFRYLVDIMQIEWHCLQGWYNFNPLLVAVIKFDKILNADISVPVDSYVPSSLWCHPIM